MSSSLSRGPLILDTLEGYRPRHIKRHHWEFDLIEGPDHEVWVHTEDLRLLWEQFPSDRELELRQGRHLLHDKSDKAWYLRARAMRVELLKCNSTERTYILNFLEWFQDQIVAPAERKRSALEPRVDTDAADTAAHPQPYARTASDRENWSQWWARRGQGLWRFIHGQQNFVLTSIVLVVVMPWCIYLLAQGLLPKSLDWAVQHRRVAWSFAILAGVSSLAGLLYAYTLSRGALRVWWSGRHRWLVTIWYLLAISGAWTLPGVFVNRDMLNYWWSGLRGKPHPVSVYADPYLGRLVLRGPFEMGSADALEAVLKANPDYKLIQLESPGGYVVEGLRMERLVRERGLDTVVMEVCASACTLVYAGGADRYLGPQARLGFHRSGLAGTLVDYGWNEMDYRMQKVWLDRGVDPRFTERALKEPLYRMWVPHPYDMLKARYATAMWDQRKPGY